MPQASIAPIFAAFAAHGGEQYGERVSQLDHALQCAHLAADAVRLRRWDDAGKIAGWTDIAPLQSYRPILLRCAKT